MNSILTNHVKEENEATSPCTMISHVVHMAQCTKKEQFLIWDLISNYHWFKNTMIGGTQPVKEVKNQFSNHMFFHPQIDKGSEKSRQHVPNSPRMHLLFLLSSDVYDYSITRTIKDYFNHDNPHDVQEVQDPPESCQEPPRKKRRKQVAKLITLSQYAL